MAKNLERPRIARGRFFMSNYIGVPRLFEKPWHAVSKPRVGAEIDMGEGHEQKDGIDHGGGARDRVGDGQAFGGAGVAYCHARP